MITGIGAFSVIAVWNFCMNLCTARDIYALSCFIGKTCTKLGIDYIGISAEDMQWK